uniref:Uncharacterized protein n=1 Tax=Myoviridae sp. ct5Xl4 TaxID=2826613 RepID=A0A8S5M1Y6_9CAUD|nr:MAG TPA: hypothetical protein [Myoviridae sp. ct5Xl4]
MLNGHINISSATNSLTYCALDNAKVAGSFFLTVNLGVIS